MILDEQKTNYHDRNKTIETAIDFYIRTLVLTIKALPKIPKYKKYIKVLTHFMQTHTFLEKRTSLTRVNFHVNMSI